jgi:hypothetical protein
VFCLRGGGTRELNSAPHRRRRTCALQLQLVAVHFAEVHCASVAQLAREAAKLIADVAVRSGLRSGQHSVAAEHQCQLGLVDCAIVAVSDRGHRWQFQQIRQHCIAARRRERMRDCAPTRTSQRLVSD